VLKNQALSDEAQGRDATERVRRWHRCCNDRGQVGTLTVKKGRGWPAGDETPSRPLAARWCARKKRGERIGGEELGAVRLALSILMRPRGKKGWGEGGGGNEEKVGAALALPPSHHRRKQENGRERGVRREATVKTPPQ